MKKLLFKTTLACSGCVAKIQESMNAAFGEENWSVDLQSPEKILSAQGEFITPDEVLQTLAEKGYAGAFLQEESVEDAA